MSRRGRSLRDCCAPDVRATADGLAFELRVDGRVHTVAVPLVGQFNVANLLGVSASRSPAASRRGRARSLRSPQLVPPPGRMQRVPGRRSRWWSSTTRIRPDALAKALAGAAAARAARGGRLWCVFGAGGDRDPGKRAPMGAGGAGARTVVVVTSDNPRSEDPRAIIAQIVAAWQPRRR